MFVIPEAKKENNEEKKSLIKKFFSDEMIKILYYHCLRIDIEDNNDKAEMIEELLGPEFQLLGVGTNRIAFLYRGLVVKVSMDRRGLLDNLNEFKRASETPEYFVKCYETNMLINVEEYLTLLDQEEFKTNEAGIKEILEDLSKAYIFTDIGYTLKNSCNWAADSEQNLKILDTGYIYPIKGNEDALTCPLCRSQFKYNTNYTGFVCSNKECPQKYSFMDIKRRMRFNTEELENRIIMQLNNIEMPNFDKLNDDIYR